MGDRLGGHGRPDAGPPAQTIDGPILGELWPVHSAGGWSEDLSLGREYICEERFQAP